MLFGFVMGFALGVLPAHTYGADFNPYEIPKEQFQQRVHIIALHPFELPSGTSDPEPVRQRFESLITQQLEAKGYSVVAAQEFEHIWREMAERVGGVFDPITGKADEDKLKAVREHTNREVQRRFHANAVLYSYVEIDDCIPWSKSFGSYFVIGDEILTFRGQPVPLVSLPQKTLVTYLNVGIRDLDGTKLYGIRIWHEWTKVYVARGYEERPRTQLYSDAERNSHAVDVVLKPVVNALPTAESSAPANHP